MLSGVMLLGCRIWAGWQYLWGVLPLFGQVILVISNQKLDVVFGLLSIDACLCRDLFPLCFCLLFHPSCGWSPVFATNCYHDSRYASLPEMSVQQSIQV